jgi:hypothetical protein
MGQRLELQTLLLGMCPNVYFQPPESINMVYPCFIYHRDWAITRFATNKPYRVEKRYQLTVVDEEADSPLIELVAALPMCIFDRHYTADDLHHDVYKLFF